MALDKRYCVVCGKILATKQKKCCSLSCSATYGNMQSTGENARNWKGGKTTNSDGYIKLYMPTHPFSCKAGFVYEHRYVMEQHIGRHLLKHEIVHHKNGNKKENRIENLELLENQSEHCQYHNSLKSTG